MGKELGRYHLLSFRELHFEEAIFIALRHHNCYSQQRYMIHAGTNLKAYIATISF
jgi:hypothetical protein